MLLGRQVASVNYYEYINTPLPQDNIIIARSPVADLKAIKNATELEGFRRSHIRDGAALARYFSWLEEQLNNGVELSEYQGSEKLEEFRSYESFTYVVHDLYLTCWQRT